MIHMPFQLRFPLSFHIINKTVGDVIKFLFEEKTRGIDMLMNLLENQKIFFLKFMGITY